MTKMRKGPVEAGRAPVDGLPSAHRQAYRRRSFLATGLLCLGVAAVTAGGVRATIGPRIQALEAQVEAARAETRDALSDRAVMKEELEALQEIGRYSEAFGIPVDLAGAIHEAARLENVDPDIAFRLVATESSFRRRAVSPVGAVGYTQLMPSTARWLESGVTDEDLYDRDTNLRIGFRYLRMLLDQYGDARLALLAYNRGPAVVSAMVARGEDPSNGYARQILGSE